MNTSINFLVLLAISSTTASPAAAQIPTNHGAGSMGLECTVLSGNVARDPAGFISPTVLNTRVVCPLFFHNDMAMGRMLVRYWDDIGGGFTLRFGKRSLATAATTTLHTWVTTVDAPAWTSTWSDFTGDVSKPSEYAYYVEVDFGSISTPDVRLGE